MPDAVALYKEYLEDVKLMQLATCRDNQPWLCNVWFVMDDDGNIYFMSRKSRRHSEDIALNPNVACTFHKTFTKGLGEKGQAVIISGTARMLSGDECLKPYDLYAVENPKLNEFQSKEAFTEGSGHHFFYKITPNEIVWWDEQNFPNDPRQIIK